MSDYETIKNLHRKTFITIKQWKIFDYTFVKAMNFEIIVLTHDMLMHDAHC